MVPSMNGEYRVLADALSSASGSIGCVLYEAGCDAEGRGDSLRAIPKAWTSKELTAALVNRNLIGATR
jgi:hypothetical protein